MASRSNNELAPYRVVSKMLILARSLIAKPKLILLDEITEGLQPSVIDLLEWALLEECIALNIHPADEQTSSSRRLAESGLF